MWMVLSGGELGFGVWFLVWVETHGCFLGLSSFYHSCLLSGFIVCVARP